MVFILTFFIFSFISAFLLGWYFYKGFFWNFVDVFYYPLAAVGVGLLFLANETQRDVFELNQLQVFQQESYNRLQSQKPIFKIDSAPNLLSSGIEAIEIIEDWSEICEGLTMRMTPKCIAVREIENYVTSFLEVARGSFDTYENRLITTCNAGDLLIQDLHKVSNLSGVIAENLKNTYVSAINAKLNYLDYDKLRPFIDEFKSLSRKAVIEIDRAAFTEKTKITELILQSDYESIEFGKMLLRGLAQCIFAPRDKLEAIVNWMNDMERRSDEIQALELRKLELGDISSQNGYLIWIQLTFWPFVLIFTLSLKFAKGASTIRKALDNKSSASAADTVQSADYGASNKTELSYSTEASLNESTKND